MDQSRKIDRDFQMNNGVGSSAGVGHGHADDVVNVFLHPPQQKQARAHAVQVQIPYQRGQGHQTHQNASQFPDIQSIVSNPSSSQFESQQLYEGKTNNQSGTYITSRCPRDKVLTKFSDNFIPNSTVNQAQRQRQNQNIVANARSLSGSPVLPSVVNLNGAMVPDFSSRQSSGQKTFAFINSGLDSFEPQVQHQEMAPPVIFSQSANGYTTPANSTGTPEISRYNSPSIQVVGPPSITPAPDHYQMSETYMGSKDDFSGFDDDDLIVVDERLIPMSDPVKHHLHSRHGFNGSNHSVLMSAAKKAAHSSDGELIPVTHMERHSSPSIIYGKHRPAGRSSSPLEGANKEQKSSNPDQVGSIAHQSVASSVENSMLPVPYIPVNSASVPKSVKQIPVAKLQNSTQSEEDKKRSSPAEIIEAIRKRQKTTANQDVSDEKLQKSTQNLLAKFEKNEPAQDLLIFLIKEAVSLFKGDAKRLSEKLCNIFISIPESTYHKSPDYRYIAWKQAIDTVDDRSFWLSANPFMNKLFLRVRNWIIGDMRAKDYDGIEQALTLLHEIKRNKESLESFKIWELLAKLQKMERKITIKNLAIEIMTKDIEGPSLGAKKNPAEKAPTANITSTSSVMKSISAAAKKADKEPVVAIKKSSIFINDPSKNKKEVEKPKEVAPAQQVKPQKKVWALSEYINKASQRSQAAQSESPAAEENDEDVKEKVEGGLNSILRRKQAADTVRKRRKAVTNGVRFNDAALTQTKLIESYDRADNVQGLDGGQEGAAMIGVTDDEDIEWYAPVPFDVASLDWYNAELYEGNPVFRGGDQEITSEDKQAQIKRNAITPGTNYSLIRNIPASPTETDALNVLPPRQFEAKMVPFGSAGR